jgi:hypothetical protein
MNSYQPQEPPKNNTFLIVFILILVGVSIAIYVFRESIFQFISPSSVQTPTPILTSIPTMESTMEFTPAPTIAPIDCIMSEWSACDSSGNQTRTILTEASGSGEACGNITQSCVPPPKLLGDKIQWQSNCTDCNGLFWDPNTTITTPWNRYYKVSCQNDDKESQLTDAFGPVARPIAATGGRTSYNNPKLRISGDTKNDTCGGLTTNIYRSKSKDGPYSKVDPTKLMQGEFRSTTMWDQTGGTFIDYDNNTEY